MTISADEKRRRGIALRDELYRDLVSALRDAGENAPTQCEGWVARDIATHIWVLKHDPLAWPGTIVPALSGFTAKRAAKALDEVGGFTAMLDALEREDGTRMYGLGDKATTSMMSIGEWYIHLRDVTDPNGLPVPHTTTELRRVLWVWLKTMGKMLGKNATVVEPVLQRAHTFGKEGGPVVVGDAPELLLWLTGREAKVQVNA